MGDTERKTKGKKEWRGEEYGDEGEGGGWGGEALIRLSVSW